MLFGFFLLTDRVLGLISHSGLLNKYPRLCSTGSKLYPHIILKTDQVIPTFVSPAKTKFIPLFVLSNNGQISDNPQNSFNMLFFPNPEDPPLTSTKNEFLVRDYWSSIKPMVLCRDISGYYLSDLNDPNITLFEICHQDIAECRIKRAIDKYDYSTCYGNSIEFSDKDIFIRRVINKTDTQK